MMKNWVVVLVTGCLLCCLGCSNSREEEVREQLRVLREEAEAQSWRHQQEMQRLQVRLQRVQQLNQVYQKQLDDLKQQLGEKDAEIAGLTTKVEKAKAYFRKQRQQRQQTIKAELSSTGSKSDFIHTPVGVNPDLFPLHVFNVISKRVAVGAHTGWRATDGDVTMNRSSVLGSSLKSYTMSEYENRIFFSLRNLTKTDKRVAVSAGRGRREFSIKAGGVIDNLSVLAADHAVLTVSSAGHTRQFSVP
jgi:Skp family chaperone for outer membrane proteins